MRIGKGKDTIDVPETDVSSFVMRGWMPIRDSQVKAPAPAPAPRAEPNLFKDAGRGVPTLPALTKSQRVAALRNIAAGDKLASAKALRDNESPDLGSILFPRAMEAGRNNLSFGRRATGGALDAASFPGRVISSAIAAPSTRGLSFDEAMAQAAAPDELDDGAETIAHDLVRDPLNAVLGAGKPAATAIGRRVLPVKLTEMLSEYLAPKAGEALGKAMVRGSARGTAQLGVPAALTGAGAQYSSGEDEYALPVASSFGAGIVLGGGGPAANKAGKLAFDKATAIAERTPNPLNILFPKRPLSSVIREAADNSAPIEYAEAAGLRTEPSLAALVRRLHENDVFNFIASPANTTAKKLLREQVKPAPMVKGGMEAADFEAGLNAPGVFDQLTSYSDVVGGVHGMANRSLDRIERLNNRTWKPTFDAYEDARRIYNDAVSESQHLDAPAYENWMRFFGGKRPTDLAREVPGVRFRDVAVAARDLGDDIVRNKLYAGDPTKLGTALREQLRIYGAPTETGVFSDKLKDIDFSTEFPINIAHKAKSNQFAAAFKSGDPNDPMTPARQFAANLVGKAHNRVVDNMIKQLEETGLIGRPLPSPMLNPSKEELKFARELSRGVKSGDIIEEVPPELAEAPIYGMQRAYLKGERQLPSASEASSMILEDPANASILSSRKSNLVSGTADVDAEELISNHADEKLRDYMMDYEELRAAAARHGGQRMPALSPEVQEGKRMQFADEMRQQLSMGDESTDMYTPEIMDPARKRAQQIVDDVIGQWQGSRVEPWLSRLPAYKEASTRLTGALADTRRLDAAMAPWLKLEPALQRAANRDANKYTLGAMHIGMPVLGAGAGYVKSQYDNDESAIPDMLTGAAIGLTPAVTNRLIRTPAGPKLIRDFGRMSTSATKTMSKTGAVDIADLVADVITNSRFKTNRMNDAPVDTSNVKVAEKKGVKK